MTSDFERFAVEREDPLAHELIELKRYLDERGVPLDDIRGASTMDALNLLVWRLNFGLMGEHATLALASEATGLSEEQIRRFVRAMGFTDSSTVESLLTTDDIPILALLKQFCDLVGEEQVVQLTRVIGAGLARIAEATADAIRLNIEGPQMKNVSRTEYLQLSDVIASEGLPQLAHAMDRILRYHLIQVSTQHWDWVEGSTTTSTEGAVGFADMVGFTSRSSVLSASELADVIDRFESRVSDTVISAGGRVVKFIGDEVLFVFRFASDACRCALDLLALVADESIPDVRVGIAYGDVITRHGDCYGPVVNRAARLVDVARPRAIFVTPEVVEQAGSEFIFDRCDPVVVKGIDEPMEHFALRV